MNRKYFLLFMFFINGIFFASAQGGANTINYLSKYVIQQNDTFTVFASNGITKFFLRKGTYNIYANLEVKNTESIDALNSKYILTMPTKHTDNTVLEDRVYVLKTGDTNSPNSNLMLVRPYKTSGVRLLGWGNNSNSVGSSTDTAQILAAVVDFSAGLTFDIALLKNNKVVNWGNSRSNIQFENLPQFKNIVKVSAGENFVIGLTSYGKVVGYGIINPGAAEINFSIDTLYSKFNNVIDIDAGYKHFLGLLENGKVIGGGTNEYKEGAYSDSIININSNVLEISAGGAAEARFNIALLKGDTVFTWGGYQNEANYKNINDPQIQGTSQLSKLVNIKSISAGSAQNLGLNKNDSVLGWGYNDNNEGISTDTFRKLKNVIKISAGTKTYNEGHNIALTNTGKVVGWGVEGNNSYKIGKNTDTTNKLKINIINISAGNVHNLALRRIFLLASVKSGLGDIFYKPQLTESAFNGYFINSWGQTQQIIFKPANNYKVNNIELGCPVNINTSYINIGGTKIIPVKNLNDTVYTFNNIYNDSCIAINFLRIFRINMEVINGSLTSYDLNIDNKTNAIKIVDSIAITKDTIYFKPTNLNYRLDSILVGSSKIINNNYRTKFVYKLDSSEYNPTIKKYNQIQPIYSYKNNMDTIRNDSFIKIVYKKINRLAINYITNDGTNRKIVKSDTVIVDSLTPKFKIYYDDSLLKLNNIKYRLDSILIGSNNNLFRYLPDSNKSYTFYNIINDSVINLIYRKQIKLSIQIKNGKVKIDPINIINKVNYRAFDSAGYYIAFVDYGANYNLQHFSFGYNNIVNNNLYRLNIFKNVTENLFYYFIDNNNNNYIINNIKNDSNYYIEYTRQFNYVLSIKYGTMQTVYNPYSNYSISPTNPKTETISTDLINKNNQKVIQVDSASNISTTFDKLTQNNIIFTLDSIKLFNKNINNFDNIDKKTSLTQTTYTTNNINGDSGIRVVYKLEDYKINIIIHNGNAWTSINYTKRPNQTFTENVIRDSNINVFFEPILHDPNFVFEKIIINGNRIITSNISNYLFKNVKADSNIEIFYTQRYRISTNILNGIILPYPDTIVDGGKNVTIQYNGFSNLNGFYSLKNIKIDGVDIPIGLNTNQYTFNNISDNKSIQVIFYPSYKITTRVKNGIITNTTLIDSTGNKTINFSSNIGYRLDSVFINNIYKPNLSYPNLITSYTFINMQGDSMIEVKYKRQFTLTILAINGNISVNTNNNETFIPTLNGRIYYIDSGVNYIVNYSKLSGQNYDRLVEIKINNIDRNDLLTNNLNTYTFNNMMGDSAIQVRYQRRYKVMAEIINGIINFADTIVNENTSLTIEFNYLQNGNYYRLESIVENGIIQVLAVNQNSYIINNVNSDKQIKIVYKRQFKIETFVKNGIINPLGITLVDSNLNFTFSYQASFGSILEGVYFNDLKNAILSNDSRDGDYNIKSYTLNNINQDNKIFINYKKRLAVNVEVVNGSATINNLEIKTLFVDSGTSPVIKYSGKSINYKLDSIYLENIYQQTVTNDSLLQYTFNNITENQGTIRIVYFLPLYIKSLQKNIVKFTDSIVIYGKNLNNIYLKHRYFDETIYPTLIRKYALSYTSDKPKFGNDTAYIYILNQKLKDEIYVIKGLLYPDTSNFNLMRYYQYLGVRVKGWGNNTYNQASSTNEINKLILPIVQISAGQNHNIVLTNNGKILGWGKNDYQQGESTDTLIQLENFVDISAGNDFNLALMGDGVVIGWGKNQFSQANGGNNLKNIISISAGENFGAGLLENGEIIQWGYNNNIQFTSNEYFKQISAGTNYLLGLNNQNKIKSNPNNNQLLNNFEVYKISAGDNQNLLLNKNGTIDNWGTNSIIIPNNYKTNIKDISCGISHNIAIYDSNKISGWDKNIDSLKVIGWGNNNFFQGGTSTALKKIQFPYLIDAGYYHNLVLKKIGIRTSTALTINEKFNKPSNIATITNSLLIDSLHQHVQINYKGPDGYIVDSIFINGTYNQNASLDSFENYTFNNIIDDNEIKVIFRFPFYLKKISRAIIKQNDTLIVVGSNLKKIILTEVGTNSHIQVLEKENIGASNLFKKTTDSNYIIRLPDNLKNTIYIVRGVFDNDTTPNFFLIRVYLTNAYRVIGWGDNSRLAGESTDTNSNLKKIIHIEAGIDFNLGLNTEGKVLSWGNNIFHLEKSDDTIIKINSPDNIVDFSIGENQCIALLSNGKVIGWGNNKYNKGISTNFNEELNKIIEISAGLNHNIALNIDGKLVGWGLDNFNQVSGIQNYPIYNPIQKIAAGNDFNILLTRDGNLYGVGLGFDKNQDALNSFINTKEISVGKDQLITLDILNKVFGGLENNENQGAYTNGLKLSNIKSISAGSIHNIALKFDNTIIGWGNDANGRNASTSQLPKLKNIEVLSAGAKHNIALKRIAVYTDIKNGTITPTVLLDSLNQTIRIFYNPFENIYPIDSIFINGQFNAKITNDSINSYTFYNVNFDSSIRVVYRQKIKIHGEIENGYINFEGREETMNTIDTVVELINNVKINYRNIDAKNYILDSVIINDDYSKNFYKDSINQFSFFNTNIHQKIRIVYSPYPRFLNQLDSSKKTTCQYKKLDTPYLIKFKASINNSDKNKINLKYYQWYKTFNKNKNNSIPLNYINCTDCNGSLNSFDTNLKFFPPVSEYSINPIYYFVIITNERNLKDTSNLSGGIITNPVPKSSVSINNNVLINCILINQPIQLFANINNFDTIDYIDKKIYLAYNSKENMFNSIPTYTTDSNYLFLKYMSKNLIYGNSQNKKYSFASIINNYNCSTNSDTIELQWYEKINVISFNNTDTNYCYLEPSKPLKINIKTDTNYIFNWYINKSKNYSSSTLLIKDTNSNKIFPLNLRKSNWDSAYYYAIISNKEYSCAIDTTALSGLIKINYPLFILQPDTIQSKVCENNSMHKIIKVNSNKLFSNDVTYYWYKTKDKNYNFDNFLTQALNDTFIPSNKVYDSSYYFSVLKSNTICPNLTDTSKITGIYLTFPYPIFKPISDSNFCTSIYEKIIQINYTYPWDDTLFFNRYTNTIKDTNSSINFYKSNINRSFSLTDFYKNEKNINNNYFYFVINNSNDCKTISPIIKLIFEKIPGISIDTFERIKLLIAGDAYQVSPIGDATKYWWEPSSLVSKPFCNINDKIYLTPLESTLFRIYGENDEGCIFKDSLLLNVKQEEEIEVIASPLITPKVIDGYFDYWEIENIEFYPDNEIHIFNKFSQDILILNNYKNSIKWNGLDKYGYNLLSGQYLYKIVLKRNNGTQKIIKGVLSILN